MGKVLMVAVLAGVVLYALIDAILTRRGTERLLPKWLWILVIILVPVLGALFWIFSGRPAREARGAAPAGSGATRVPGRGGRGRAPVAPDEDPAFLRKLSDDQWSRQMRERRQSGDAAPGSPDATDPSAGPARGTLPDPHSDPATDSADQ